MAEEGLGIWKIYLEEKNVEGCKQQRWLQWTATVQRQCYILILIWLKHLMWFYIKQSKCKVKQKPWYIKTNTIYLKTLSKSNVIFQK